MKIFEVCKATEEKPEHMNFLTIVWSLAGAKRIKNYIWLVMFMRCQQIFLTQSSFT